MKIQTIAVAARGEIAKRIILSCRRMGLKTVLLYAYDDIQNEAFRTADAAICIGPSDPKLSYLNKEANIQAALAGGADALHPGYGFLSEDFSFAKECEKRGLIFIGPPAEALKSLGHKLQAKKLCAKAGVATLPFHSFQTGEEALKAAEKLKFPLLFKPAAGGGGRNIHVLNNKKELLAAALNTRLLKGEEFFLEKFLANAKHIEVQAFVDASGEIFLLGERDCSCQRRRQKILEEAPADISEKLKSRLRQSVLRLLKSVNYKGVCTFEFLVHEKDFYFLEANPRLQVEHALTEALYGIDLVRAQILTAMGRPAFPAEKSFNTQRILSSSENLCGKRKLYSAAGENISYILAFRAGHSHRHRICIRR